MQLVKYDVVKSTFTVYVCACARVCVCACARVCVSSCGFVIKSTFTDRNNVLSIPYF